jgi:hypothetical protein
VDGYAGIGPIHMWYATRGQGQPLVMLHEDLATNATWAGQLGTLAEHFRVIAPERCGPATLLMWTHRSLITSWPMTRRHSSASSDLRPCWPAERERP